MNEYRWNPDCIGWLKTTGRPTFIMPKDQKPEIMCFNMQRHIEPLDVVKGHQLVFSTYNPPERNTSKLTKYQLNKLKKQL